MSLGDTLASPFLLNIDNKEILIEILNYSIDYLIGNSDEQQTNKLCHKYGFQNENDFMLTTRKIARCYRSYCTDDAATEADLLSEFSNLSPELQRQVSAVFEARRPELIKYLVRLHNAQEHPLVQSFDWDLRLIMGDSSFAQHCRHLVAITFNCCQSNGKENTLHLQVECEKLDELIAAAEKALHQVPTSRADIPEENTVKA